MSRIINTIITVVDKASRPIDHVSSNALVLNFVLALIAGAIFFSGGVYLLNEDTWILVSRNLGDNIFSGAGILLTTDPLISDEALPGLIWPGPISAAWVAFWTAIKAPFLSSGMIALMTLILTSLMTWRLARGTALVVGLMCAFYPDLWLFAQKEPQILLAMNLALASSLCLPSSSPGRSHAVVSAFFSIVAISVHPIAFPYCLVTASIISHKRTALQTIISFSPPILFIVFLAMLIRFELFDSYVQCLNFDHIPWTTLHKHLYSFWIIFASKPLSYIFLLFAIHALMSHREFPNDDALKRQALFAILGLILFLIIYLAHKKTAYEAYIVPAYVFALPLVGLGFDRALTQVNSDRPRRKSRIISFTIVAIIYFIGINSLESQIMNAIVLRDKVVNKETFVTTHNKLRSLIPPDQWIFVANDWDLLDDFHHIVYPGDTVDSQSLERISLRKQIYLSGALYLQSNTAAQNLIFSDGSTLSDWDCLKAGEYNICLRPDLIE